MDEVSTSMSVPKISIGYLIQKLLVMCKKPSIESDLSRVLDEYLKILRESQIYFSNGICTISFAEAALFIDNIVVLYSKKIDILWEKIFDYQKNMLSYERKTEKTRDAELLLEERRQKYKRRRKKPEQKEKEVVDEAAMDCLVESLVDRLEEDLLIAEEFSFEDDKNLLKYCDDIRAKVLPKQTATKPFNPYNQAGFVTMDFLIYDDEELMCDNRYLATEHALFLLPEHVRQIAYNIYKKRNIELIGYDIGDKLLQQFIVERHIKNLEATRDMALLINTYVKLHLDLCKRQDVNLIEEHKKLCMRRSSILLTRLPDSVVQQYLKDDDAVSSSAEQSEDSDRQNEEEKINLNENAPQHKNSGDSGFFDESFLDDVNHSGEIEEKMVHIDACNSDGNDSGTECEPNECTFDQVVTSTPRSSLHAEKLQEIKTTTCTFELRARKRKLEIEDDDEANQKPKRVSRRGPKSFKWLPTTTTKLKIFERFYHYNYEPDVGEGQVVESEFSDSEDDPDHDDAPPENTELIQSSAGILQDINEVPEPVETVEAEPCTSSTASAISKLLDYDGFMEFIQAKQAEQAPFFEWRDFIEKKLASSDKTEFDIHKFGTDVLNGIPKTEPIYFSSLMKGRKSSDVVRYFISSLQLANTYNIELIHSNDAQLESNTLKLKLLSKERYHENLSAYHAPSEISLPKKLAQIQALTALMSVGPSSSKGCKRRKLNF